MSVEDECVVCGAGSSWIVEAPEVVTHNFVCLNCFTALDETHCAITYDPKRAHLNDAKRDVSRRLVEALIERADDFSDCPYCNTELQLCYARTGLVFRCEHHVWTTLLNAPKRHFIGSHLNVFKRAGIDFTSNSDEPIEGVSPVRKAKRKQVAKRVWITARSGAEEAGDTCDVTIADAPTDMSDDEYEKNTPIELSTEQLKNDPRDLIEASSKIDPGDVVTESDVEVTSDDDDADEDDDRKTVSPSADIRTVLDERYGQHQVDDRKREVRYRFTFAGLTGELVDYRGINLCGMPFKARVKGATGWAYRSMCQTYTEALDVIEAEIRDITREAHEY